MLAGVKAKAFIAALEIGGMFVHPFRRFALVMGADCVENLPMRNDHSVIGIQPRKYCVGGRHHED